MFTADIISTVEFNYSGDLLATGDKGGRVVIFQREQEVSDFKNNEVCLLKLLLSFSFINMHDIATAFDITNFKCSHVVF